MIRSAIVKNPPSSLDKIKLSPTQLAILEILVRDGTEFEISTNALVEMNSLSALILSVSGGKKSKKLIPERVRSIIAERMPYLDLEPEGKDSGREEILAQARKEAEILAMNPNLSPLSFLKGGPDGK